MLPPEPWGFIEGVVVGLWAVGVGVAVGIEVSALQQRRLTRRRLEAREQEAATEALIAQSHDSQAMLHQACDDLIAYLEAERPVRPGDPPADAP